MNGTMKKYKVTDLETVEQTEYSKTEWDASFGIALVTGILIGATTVITIFMLFFS